MDIVFVRGLRVDAVIGIYDWERRIKQTVVLDLEMATDVRKAAATDDIKDALDYKAVAKRVETFIAESEFQLVETMWLNIVRRLFVMSSVCLGCV